MCICPVAPPPLPFQLGREELHAGEAGVIGRYTLLEVLGAGTYATVYRAVETRSGQAVAVKLLRTTTPTEHKSAVHEVVLNMRVKHRLKSMSERRYQAAVDLLPPLLDVCEPCSTPGTCDQSRSNACLVFGLLEGGTLEHYLENLGRSGRRTTDAEAKTAMRRLLSAIAALHDAGVAHCDVKPANLMLGLAGDLDSLTLIDLGFAVDLLSEGSRQAQGTPHYCAPEQARAFFCRDSASYGTEVDTWAVGVVLHRLLFGELPFTGYCNTELLQSVMMYNDRLPGATLAQCSDDARSLLAGLLCSDPQKRLTAREALRHPYLQDAEHSCSSLASVVSPLTEIYGKIASRTGARRRMLRAASRRHICDWSNENPPQGSARLVGTSANLRSPAE
mmetsp:Transcript_33399/g.83732  ORF Transcript_33399/g.83732 Transcript_33399/m.83732 type:complete len:390 (-) Transcript_33399:220-1389(-)